MSGIDDFQFVKRKHRGSRKLLSNIQNRTLYNDDSVEELIKKVTLSLQNFKESPFYQSLFSGLQESLQILCVDGIKDIICYGLGNFSEYRCSKNQLAALLSFKERFSSNIYLYDPMFTIKETECLTKLGLHLIEKNEEGKRLIKDEPTLVYMPHCAKQLTNNFLFANWGPSMSNCILLGNSWSDLVCHTTEKVLQESATYIVRLKPCATEIKLTNNFEYFNTFSGTSFHIFPKEKLNTVSSGFWEHHDEPKYINNDPEFIKIS